MGISISGGKYSLLMEELVGNAILKPDRNHKVGYYQT